MKLSSAIGFLAVSVRPEESNKKNLVQERLQFGSGPGHNLDGQIGIPDAHCSTHGVDVLNDGDYYSGSLEIPQSVDNMHCYAEVGSNCSDAGVKVQITQMAVESKLMDNGYAIYYWACHDSIHFVWNENGNTKETDEQCGCVGGPQMCYGISDDYYNFSTEDPTTYVLPGSDVKLVYYTNEIYSGGKIKLNWQCIEQEPASTTSSTTTSSTTTSTTTTSSTTTTTSSTTTEFQTGESICLSCHKV